MNMKISLVMIAGVLASSMAMAAEKTQDPAVFQAAKDQRVANLQERLQIIQTHLTCAQAAQDSAALKACHDTAKQQGDAFEAKMKAQGADKKGKKNK
jgi:hypothetical protein